MVGHTVSGSHVANANAQPTLVIPQQNVRRSKVEELSFSALTNGHGNVLHLLISLSERMLLSIFPEMSNY